LFALVAFKVFVAEESFLSQKENVVVLTVGVVNVDEILVANI
jgi:hypothetical protein